MVDSSHSERRGPGGRPPWAVPTALVLACVLFGAVAALAGTSADRTDIRVTGKHGLAVAHVGDSVIVRWITQDPAEGLLEVHTGDRRLARVETAIGYAHRAAVLAGDAESLTLRYGPLANDEERHEKQVSLNPPARPPIALDGVDSLYVLGDTHGELDALIDGLRAAGLVDSELRWSGGTSHLVFAGDLTDRGPDVIGLLWLVYRLEREAADAGGAVHVVLGNHEIMVMLGDLRYVHPKEVHIAELHGVPYDQLFDVRTSILGRWLASKPALIRVDRALIAHGGLGERFADFDLVALDDSLRAYAGEELFARWADTTYMPPIDSAAMSRRNDFFWHPESAFWHREFVEIDTADVLLERVLGQMDSDLFVVAHTPVPIIQARYDGRVIATHTPRHGAELLLLVRRDGGYERYRVTDAGHERF